MNEEFEESSCEAFVDQFAEFIRQTSENRVKVINIERYMLMLKNAIHLKALLSEEVETEAHVSIEINDLFNSGSISANLNELVIHDPTEFSALISEADNFEIYPKTDGTIQLNITFYSVLNFL